MTQDFILDDLFEDAKKIVIKDKNATMLHLQRRLQIDYARAGKIIDQLETVGVVSAPDATGERSITHEETAKTRKITEKSGDTETWLGFYLPFVLLVALGILIVLITSRPLEEAFAYSSFHFTLNHLLHIGVGIVILFVMSKLKGIWFDRIGAGVLVVSIVAFSLMLFYPEYHEGRVFMKIGSFTMQPTLYFVLGVVWFFDFSLRNFIGYQRWVIGFVSMMIFLVWLLMVKVDPPIMIFIGLCVLGMVGYRYGISKTFILFFGGLIAVFTLVILNAPYRMNRIQSWWEMIVSGKSFVMPSGIDLLISKMHEGLFAYNEWGGVVLAVIVATMIWLISTIWRFESIFAKGVAFILIVDILFHIINFFGLTILKPPVLFIVEYGLSITLVSFLMIGMVMMSLKQDQGVKQ